MSTQNTIQFNFTELLKPLEAQLRESEQNYCDFENACNALNGARSSLQKLLEYAVQTNRGKKEFERIYRRLAGENATSLIDKLSRVGYACKNDKTLGDIFTKQGYRILEQTRAGKRQDVYYNILRIFFSAQKEFPKDLIEVFKPIYSDEMFKVFLFSFLSGVLGKKSQSE